MKKIKSLTSTDIVAQNIETLKQLFPTIVKEGKIDEIELKAILGEYIEDKEEYYRFTWAGKSEARAEANKPSTATLRPDKESSKDWDTTGNIFIEGDNLEVLKLLQKSYSNKIKMIYIDPPYNTGNDFVYKDNYKDNLANYLEQTGQLDEEGRKTSTNSDSDGRYHSNWLNMMYPRLKLARNLMSDDGVIFISIDDNEQSNLKKLCDEVFGEENFLGQFVVNSTPNARDYGHIGKMHEYVFFYGKNIYHTQTNMLPNISKIFKYEDHLGGYNIHPLYNSNENFHKGNRPNLHYPFYLNPNSKDENSFYAISLEKKEGWIEVYPPLSVKNKVEFVWRWGKDKAIENLNKEIVGYIVGGECRIVQKMRNDEKIIRSLLLEKSYSSRRGTAELENIFEEKIFSFPKPLALLADLTRCGSANNSIILDFFAGSGTTAHAVMQLNAEDGGNRKCISVQLPEPTDEKSEAYKAGYSVISDITKERIRRAGEKIKADNKDKEGIDKLDVGFKAFKLDSSNIRAWDSSKEALQQQLDLFVENNGENMKADRTEEDILFEVLLKYGLDLSIKIEQREVANTPVYNIGYGSLFICLANNITTVVSEGIGAWKEELEPATCRVIFKDTGFASDADKTNSMQILKRFHITEVATI